MSALSQVLGRRMSESASPVECGPVRVVWGGPATARANDEDTAGVTTHDVGAAPLLSRKTRL
eukprot:scaffold240763_cov19-Prasinocladus_malaysianus.AAC.1